jgi:hypothetical protein
MENERWMIHSVLVFFIHVTIAVALHSIRQSVSFLSLKISFHMGHRYFSLLLLQVFYLFFKRKDLDTDAVYTMLSLISCVLYLYLSIISGNRDILFIDGNSLREWYGFAELPFSGVVGVDFIYFKEIVFGVALVVQWRKQWSLQQRSLKI